MILTRPRCLRRPRAPHVVIDDRGVEVGAYVTYPEYRRLLDLLDRHVGAGRLTRYWRRALADRLGDGGGPDGPAAPIAIVERDAG